MRAVRSAVTVLVSALPTACASRASAPVLGAEATACVVGPVTEAVEGPVAEPVLRPERGGEPVRLRGDLAALAAAGLAGATIEVCGATAVAGGTWSLQADELDLRRVDGMDAHLGVLERGRGWVLERSAGWPREVGLVFATVPAALAAERGNLVWIAGRWDGRDFAVLRYGVVR